jgi:hypothetical protein
MISQQDVERINSMDRKDNLQRALGAPELNEPTQSTEPTQPA